MRITNAEYSIGALRTESPVTPEMVARFTDPETAVLFLSAIQAIITQGQEMDKLKKHLFYEKPLPTFGSRQHWVAPAVLERLSNPGVIRLLHAAIGLVTESAELFEMLYAHVVEDEKLDPFHLIEEAGDQFWYLAILADTLSATFEDIMVRNQRKLRARYHDAEFHRDMAVTRDLPTERARLEASE